MREEGWRWIAERHVVLQKVPESGQFTFFLFFFFFFFFFALFCSVPEGMEGERFTSCHHVKRGYTAQILKGAFGDEKIRWRRSLGEKWDCTPKKWIFQWQNFKPFVFFHKQIFLFLINFFLAVFDQKLQKYWVFGWQHYFKGSLGKEWAEKGGLKSRTFYRTFQYGSAPPSVFCSRL